MQCGVSDLDCRTRVRQVNEEEKLCHALYLVANGRVEEQDDYLLEFDISERCVRAQNTPRGRYHREHGPRRSDNFVPEPLFTSQEDEVALEGHKKGRTSVERSGVERSGGGCGSCRRTAKTSAPIVTLLTSVHKVVSTGYQDPSSSTVTIQPPTV